MNTNISSSFRDVNTENSKKDDKTSIALLHRKYSKAKPIAETTGLLRQPDLRAASALRDSDCRGQRSRRVPETLRGRGSWKPDHSPRDRGTEKPPASSGTSPRSSPYHRKTKIRMSGKNGAHAHAKSAGGGHISD